MSSRKKKRDKKKRARVQARQRGRPRKGPLLGSDLVVTPPGGEKMSEVLMEFLEPYNESVESEEGSNKLLTVGVAAWNAALLSGKERTDFIDKMVGAIPAESRPTLRAILAEMIQRKETLFPHNRRMIINYELRMAIEGPRLSVLSTFPDEGGVGEGDEGQPGPIPDGRRRP